MTHTIDLPSPSNELRVHSKNFRKQIVEVTRGVFVAIGYSASNVTLIQGRTGSIIVDTSANPVDAAAIVAAFGDRLVRPVHAIIYTHNHPDHSGGATVFAGDDAPEIWSHERLVTGEPELARGMRDGGDQFGIALPEDQFINAGIQRQYGRETPHTREGFLPPTRTFGGREHVLHIDGVDLHLLHTPGESEENTALWRPGPRVLLCGDDLYRSFPNLSPLRGVRLRPPEAWIASLDRMIALGPEHLVPGHMQPVHGTAEVTALLTIYRDAIRFVLEATVDGIRKGLTPDELVQQVRLPEEMARQPYLREYYGCVAWTVRGIYADRVGWFDGNPATMFPLAARARAERMEKMVGGRDTLLAHATEVLAQDDAQWAAELADLLLALDPACDQALCLKADALVLLAERQINAPARNYYLTVAATLRRRAGTEKPASC
ncbi:alkyl/aryl-sulfatase [Falsirhodobacter sp. 20TX0035]|uniref:alkyl/aryl-sulfatase n=1 Tax=Falsirhodobacter sp. 20TX0035 TaxID=3022019 RepID=UPI00232BEA36|nr:alkyl/aryl-sulfatase [Falsirhodobacter sp. 20TX0035]MDB6455208.1 alkyl/aryl-sulfatase [Falsirhodobacter sp. 20TX0035]